MALTLYMHPLSPPSRGALLAIHALGLENKVNLVVVDIPKREHLKPDFLEKNPVHTVPTLVDGDFILWDSHAINGYLVNKYAKNDELYPKEPKKRALVDAMNQFDSSYLFSPGAGYWRSKLLPEQYPDPDKLKAKYYESLDMLESILEKRAYVAGDDVTIADLSILSTVSMVSAAGLAPQPHKHSKVIGWLEKMKTKPYYHVIEEGLKYGQVFRENLLKQKQPNSGTK